MYFVLFCLQKCFLLWFFYILGLKREHKDNLELLQKDHDEALFKLRGQQATSVEYYIEKIQGVISHKISNFRINYLIFVLRKFPEIAQLYQIWAYSLFISW